MFSTGLISNRGAIARGIIRRCYFRESNNRLPVEHGVTGRVTCTDLVDGMGRVGAGEPDLAAHPGAPELSAANVRNTNIGDAAKRVRFYVENMEEVEGAGGGGWPGRGGRVVVGRPLPVISPDPTSSPAASSRFSWSTFAPCPPP